MFYTKIYQDLTTLLCDNLGSELVPTFARKLAVSGPGNSADSLVYTTRRRPGRGPYRKASNPLLAVRNPAHTGFFLGQLGILFNF